MHNSGCNSGILLVKYCAIISGSRKHWKPPVFCLIPSLPVPFSVTVSLSVCPCASAAILPSFLSLPGVLYFFASSLHQPPFSSRLLSLSPSLHVVVLLYLTPRSFPNLHPATSPWLHPFSSTATPSITPSVLLPVTMHHAVSYLLVTFCVLLGTQNSLLSLTLSLCPVFHLFYMMPLSSFHRCPRLSLHVLMLQCAFAFKAISTFNTLACPTCWPTRFHFKFLKKIFFPKNAK